MPWLKEANIAIVITGRPTVSKYWLQDASIASGFVWLAAVNLGLGCAFGAVYNLMDEKESHKRESYVREALEIPNDRSIIAILGIGYENKKPASKRMASKSEVIHYNTFGSNP
ncbi:nitroreductase family protein [Alkalihalobacillus sp. BA299]|uniref:nitroreductase family protein n=1 Tax=Alkalihalobacillus sp. BA299 TaxID=2815938 RepID=UPI001ADAB6B4|nr:nitroreductase family protein [Alkalihalobacillus sp. BA299]